MAKTSTAGTMERVREKALELGVYLPLGAYSKIRDELSDLSRPRLRKAFDDLIDRGQERMQPVERLVRRKSADVERRVDDAVDATQKQARRTTKRASAAAQATAPKFPRVAAPKTADELPIASYDSLTAAEIVSALNGLTQTELAKVYKYERANENRTTVLEAVESRFIELPIATYDALTVEEIVARLEQLSADERDVLRRYEEQTKARKTVLEKLGADA